VLKGRDHFRELGVNGMMVMKRILIGQDVRVRSGLHWLRQGPVAALVTKGTSSLV
jgi:hypothetical protein